MALSAHSARSSRSAPTSKSTMHLPYLPLHAPHHALRHKHCFCQRAYFMEPGYAPIDDHTECIRHRTLLSPSQVKSGIYKGNVWKSGRIYPIITCTHTLLPPSSLHVRPMADAPCIFQMQITEDEDAHKLGPLPPISTSPNTRMLPW